MECLSYCLANRIDFQILERQLKAIKKFTVNKHWRVLEIIDQQRQAYCYVFANGTIVSWNIKRYQMKNYLPYIEDAFVDKLPIPLYDAFSYFIADSTIIYPHEYFNVDCISLEADDAELKLSLSYGFSESMKLQYYEFQLDTLIERYTPLIHSLTTRGGFSLTRRKIRQIIGNILEVKGKLNLAGNFLYQPKFFWKHPNLETYFDMAERYLDISKRTKTMNRQLDTLNEIFLLFNTYLENKYSHRLEVIIILLIAVEIIFNLMNLHFS